jgi:two-component system nitrogen regulation sensor histidine kinase NtrY
LKEFLTSINQEDFSNLYIADESDKEITGGYRSILEKFRHLRIQKESHYQYLLRIIEHVDTALICLDQKENIQLINRSAKELLEIPDIRDLKPLVKIDKNLVKVISGIRSGQRELIKTIRNGKLLNLSIRATEFSIENEKFKLISFQDIKTELEEQEVDSWYKLVRILTHEIMNSTIPITNLISFAQDFLVDDNDRPKKIPGLKTDEIKDLVESLKTAESRSKGLVNFVKTTKNLTQIPKPSFREFPVENLFNRVHNLMQTRLNTANVDFRIFLPRPGLTIKADFELTEQVLINLILNAIEAVENSEEPSIQLSAEKISGGQVRIRVRDNGPGIDEEILEQIFIPFFTTKEKGSGIGLSLSRQIMRLHKGRIDVETGINTGTTFTLEF